MSDPANPSRPSSADVVSPSRLRALPQSPLSTDEDTESPRSFDEFEETFSQASTAHLTTVRTVSIATVLMVAMCVSSAASIAGGMVMYFESVESLEQTVAVLSDSELNYIAQKLNYIVDRPANEGTEMLSGLYSPRVITPGMAPSEWADAVRHEALSRILVDDALYCVGVVLIPETGRDEEYVYLVQWAELLANGTRTFTMGMRYPPAEGGPVSAGPNGTVEVVVNAYHVNKTSGDATRRMYTYDAGFYYSLVADFDAELLVANGSGVVGGGGFVRPDDSTVHTSERLAAVARRKRSQQMWVPDPGTDLAAYTYSGWDSIYEPPPPPHPWSGYKYVIGVGLYVYRPWRATLQEYAKRRSGTTVLLIDAASRDMLATTTEHPTLRQDCLERDASRTVADTTCATKLDDLPRWLQDSYDTLAARGGLDAFGRVNTDEGSFFVRLKPLGVQEIVLLYTLNTSTVQHHIDDALVVLAIFSVLVFLFDATITAFEYFFVGKPMRSVSAAINHLGQMRIEAAKHTVAPIMRRTFMLSEMRELLIGLDSTVNDLAYLRAFVPDTAFRESCGDIEPPDGHVAIAFTDIVRSTLLWEAVPTDMARAVDLHNDAMRNTLRRHRGYEVKTIGDAFMVAFAEADHALAFGVDVQEALLESKWPDSLKRFENSKDVLVRGKRVFSGLRVRIGIHTGPVELEINPLTNRADYRGGTVNKAARIEGQALPGMTAFSEETASAIVGFDAVVRPFGTFELKGIGNSQLYYSVNRALSLRELQFAVERELRSSAGRHRLSRTNPLQRVGDATTLADDRRRTTTIEVVQSPKGTVTTISSPRGSPSASPRASNATAITGTDTLLCHPRKAPRFSLSEDQGALAVVGVEGVRTRAVTSCDPSELGRTCSRALQMISDISAQTEGKLESILGMTSVVTWQLSTRCSAYTLQCLRYIGIMSRRSTTPLVIGAVSGPLVHGNIGAERRLYHGILGAGYEYAMSLAARCRSYGVRALFASRNPLNSRFGEACMPIEVAPAQGSWAPHVVIERPLVHACFTLDVSTEALLDASDPHDDHRSMFEADNTRPLTAFRDAIYDALRTDAALSAPPADAIDESIADDLKAVQDALAARPAGQLVNHNLQLYGMHEASLNLTSFTTSYASQILTQSSAKSVLFKRSVCGTVPQQEELLDPPCSMGSMI